jgi:hypothetical protein
VSFIAIMISAWLNTSLCSTAGRWVISHGMKPRTRPRRTISSIRPSSATPSGVGPQVRLVEHQVQWLHAATQAASVSADDSTSLKCRLLK